MLFFVDETELAEPARIQEREPLTTGKHKDNARKLGKVRLSSNALEGARHPEVDEELRAASAKVEEQKFASSRDIPDRRPGERGLDLAAWLGAAEERIADACTEDAAADHPALQIFAPDFYFGKFRHDQDSAFRRRCCTALAESEIRLWWWPRYVSSMKYPKRCQYKHAKQKKYHVRNWAEYNEGLHRRGDLTVWFDEEAIANWKADKTGKPGGQRVYSDMAIETGLVVRMVYKLAYRQTEGFLHSIASLLGLGIEIPDYSTLCRRSRLLRKKLRIPKAASTQPIHLMIDSTGLRIHVGNARKPPKLRAWRKLHIAVDRETGNIVASELTASRARDATRVPALLTQIQAPLVSVAADSAYDKEAVYEAIEAHSPGRRTRVVIPPQRNATLSQNSNTAMQERDRHIRAIERHGRREWYKLSGYTKRSMVENAVYRYKAIIGPEMRARTLARQRVEHRIGCEILNKMAALGMPDTYCAG